MLELQTIPDGRAGLDVKVAKIRSLVEQAKRSPAFRARAGEIVAGVPERDWPGEVSAVFHFVRDGIRYTRDPWAPGGLELFTAPAAMLDDVETGRAFGDCDDHVILASALLETLGHRTRYRIGGLPPDHFRHIWLEVQQGGRWLPLELVKKDEPMGFDPSSRFPLTLTLDGTMTTNAGLGAASRLSRNPNTIARRHAAQGRLIDATNREMEARRETRQAMLAVRSQQRPSLQQIREQRRASWERAVGNRRRRGVGDLAGLGDYEVPPSIDNTPQEARWYGYTPSDLWRNDELADAELEGFGGSLRKLRRKVKQQVKKAGQQVKKAREKLKSNVSHGLKSAVSSVRQFRSGLQSTVGGLFRGMAQQSGEATEPGAMMPITDPPSSGLYPDTLLPSDSYGGGGDYAMMEPMETPDPWAGWDATSESEEVDSLYTPATAESIGPDAELPGAGEGSFVPTPAWPDTSNPFTQPVGGGGMDYDAMDTMDPVAVFGENESDLGDWIEQLATQVVAPLAQTYVQYQTAKVQAKAAKAGYPMLPSTMPALPTTPVPSVPAQPIQPTIVYQQAPAGETRPRAGAAMATYGPWIFAGVGAVVLFALVSGSRRRR